MYERITAENPYEVPMRIYPAVHYTMGGLWVDYDLQTTVPGLFAIGEANFSDHGANRLGASALMQGLGDGYFVLPSTINDYLARHPHGTPWTTPPPGGGRRGRERTLAKLLAVDGDRTPDSFHREIGELMWEYCGMARSEEGLRKALDRIPEIRAEFWRRKVPGSGEEFNQSLEKANRVVDYLELAELMCLDALHRAESCGGHFREESQTPDGEAARQDEAFSYAAAWEFTTTGAAPVLHKEDLVFRVTSTPPSGATHEAHPARLAPARRRRPRPHGLVRGRRDLRGHVLPGDARHPQRGPHPARRGPGRLRPRLPRGHLRRLQPRHQRRRPRPGAHHHLPAPHAVLLRRRHHRRRALAGRRLPGGQGPRRRPGRLRPDRPGGRLHHRPHRLRPRGARDAVPKADADFAFEHAECIGCGACVAACPNGSAMLFTSAKVNHLKCCRRAPERETRVLDMVAQMDEEGFGGCTLTGECATACPKGIPLDVINQLNKDLRHALTHGG